MIKFSNRFLSKPGRQERYPIFKNCDRFLKLRVILPIDKSLTLRSLWTLELYLFSFIFQAFLYPLINLVCSKHLMQVIVN